MSKICIYTMLQYNTNGLKLEAARGVTLLGGCLKDFTAIEYRMKFAAFKIYLIRVILLVLISLIITYTSYQYFV